jgi:hypothetical protein
VSDTRRRTAEREAALGDIAARSRLLAERVRIGELLPERLELAAYCDSPEALALFNVEEYQQSTSGGYFWWKRLVIPMSEGGTRYVSIPRELKDWVRDLGRWGDLPFARVALIAAKAACDALPECSCGCSDPECCSGCSGCLHKEPAELAIKAAEAGDMRVLRLVMADRGEGWLAGLLAADYERPWEVVIPSVIDAASLLHNGHGQLEMHRILEADLRVWALA